MLRFQPRPWVLQRQKTSRWVVKSIHYPERDVRQSGATVHIEIDLQEEEIEVADIIGTDWFQKAQSLRNRPHAADAPRPA
jgi:hypothetical protein